MLEEAGSLEQGRHRLFPQAEGQMSVCVYSDQWDGL